MSGARSILTGFTVGMMVGAVGFFAAAGEALAPQPIVGPAAIVTSMQETSQAGSHVIGNEPGGYIVVHALQMFQWRERGTSLRFTGQCDSACTLYLALPYEQTCVEEGASFRFHAPTAQTERVAKLALEYLLRSYPKWVNDWIHQSGGLSEELITMDYGYARQFMRGCDAHSPRIVHVATEDKPS